MSLPAKASLARLAVLFALAGFAGALWAEAAVADPNPFSRLNGSWRGSGQVSPLGGASERVLCRVSYRVSGSKVSQSINCAGADYRINASGDITVSGGKLSGSWREQVYGVGGGVSGTAKGNSIFARISSDKFNGRMSIKAAGSRHTVSITQFDPGSGKYTPMASITLRR